MTDAVFEHRRDQHIEIGLAQVHLEKVFVGHVSREHVEGPVQYEASSIGNVDKLRQVVGDPA